MRRHVIIGHFGPGDRVQIPVAPDEVMTWIDLVASYRRLGHGIGDAFDDLQRLGIFPSETGLDLLILAALVHAADTRISRATESQDTWTREIRLVADRALGFKAQPVAEREIGAQLPIVLRVNSHVGKCQGGARVSGDERKLRRIAAQKSRARAVRQGAVEVRL